MQLKRSILGIGLLGTLLAGLALAQPQTITDAPTSPAALKAVANYTTAVGRLDDDYSRRLDAIRQQYIKELDIARKAALEKDDLDEAQRLLAEKKRVEIAALQPGANKGLVILCVTNFPNLVVSARLSSCSLAR